ncbi:MAG: hypothetical protein IIA59_08225 [Candidatus Marinimicrobia bacterium]|nr:hypothetical protein [Candidatus Neomarinimicrobiota bacterium]
MSHVLLPAERNRKLIHIGSGAIALGYALTSRGTTLAVLAILLALMILAEAARLVTPWGARTYNRFFGLMTRPEESRALTGASFLLAGAVLTVVVFPAVIAIPALLFMSWGDAAAALVGQKYGRLKWAQGKTVEGSLACLVVCLLIVVPFELSLAVKLSGAVAATIAELLPWGFLNDNLAVPLFSGGVMLTMMATGL